MFGTSVWKEMTAHTVPMSLRHVDDFQKGQDDKNLYTKLREVRKVRLDRRNPESSAPSPKHWTLSAQSWNLNPES
jgi:hypothetical protein